MLPAMYAIINIDGQQKRLRLDAYHQLGAVMGKNEYF